MREKELRFALVCFGGVSLAIYMHGVTKEILKLARASQAYHNTPDPLNRKNLTYPMVRKSPDYAIDTESIYFDFLKDVGENLDLRVIVDAVAGASAGGMNAVFLARALAHDLSMDSLRDIWLYEADISRLAVQKKPPGFWTRTVTGPIVKLVARHFMGKGRLSESMSKKIPGILRFRRMKPPFDGPHLLAVLYDALAGMGRRDSPLQSLLPAGHRLDLFVTVTDFFGHMIKIPLHDPPEIEEHEHRHILKFGYQRWRNGEYMTDLDLDDVPALAFAARATSSFPGVFPPAQIKDVDKLLAQRNLEWHKREHFLFNNFETYYKAGMDPTKTSFLDGSVLNNKPFAQAIQSIHARPAYREVDRRIVYIDPHPEDQPPPPSGIVPSLLGTLKGALSDIPRNQPIHDDLAGIQGFNKRIRMVRNIINSIRPSVTRLVQEITAENNDESATVAHIRRWREEANGRAAHENGISYEGYARLKVNMVVEDISHLITEVCGFASESAEQQDIQNIVLVWTGEHPIDSKTILTPASRADTPEQAIPSWIRFLQQFDISYQKRRVRFVIQHLNSLYGHKGEKGWEDVHAEQLDKLKAQFYENLALIRQFEKIDFIASETRQQLRAVFGRLIKNKEGKGPADFPPDQRGEIDMAMALLAADIQLASAKGQVDQIIADLYTQSWPEEMLSEMLLAYLGFSFWDVITFGLMGTDEIGEFNEIKVDRISANDVRALGADKAETRLKGVALAHFGAFFSRKDRENDYLWGRLDGAERLIDILYDSARPDLKGRDLDIMSYKKRAFQAILDEESRHLLVSSVLIADLREIVARL